MKGEKPLRDIADYGAISPTELAHYQSKIAAAGEMKTAIKRFLDHHDVKCSHTKALKKVMEDYLNVCNP